jgi:MFS family permease
MIPPSKLAPAQCWNPSQVESQPNPRLPLLPTKRTQPAREIPVWRRWLVVLGAFLALFCTFGQLSSFGTYLSWYRHNQLDSYSPAAISLIGSLQLWVFFFSVSASVVHHTTMDSNVLDKGGVVGWYFDRYGPRPILVTGAAIYVPTVMMIGFCQSYYQYLLVQGVLFGLGVGLMWVSLSQHDIQSAYH